MSSSPTTRRLMAILTTDVVGYSRMMEADEEGTLASLSRLQEEILKPRILKSGGRTIKVMGDGLLSIFDSPAVAISTALQVQHLLASEAVGASGTDALRIRIGINYAEIMITQDDVFGDGVNVAARLEQYALPDGICISETTHDILPEELQRLFVDGGLLHLKNISRPVRAWHWPRTPTIVQSIRTVVAVLPFQSADEAANEFLVDGFTEDIISGLARFRSLSVIAVSSAFAFRDRSEGLKEVGRKLAANYLVTGNMRRSGDEVRITVRMIQADTERLVWSEKYQRQAADIFGIQDEIVKMIVANLVGQIESCDYRESLRRPPASLAAYEYYLRGLVHLRGYEPDDNVKAVEMFEAAVAGDGGFALAHAHLALARIAVGGYANAPEAVLRDGIALARHAVKLDEGEAGAHRVLGLAHLYLKDFDNSEREFRLAYKLNSSDAHALVQLGGLLARRNRVEEALPLVEEGMRLNPYPPHWYHAVLGNLLYFKGDYEQALAALKQLPNPGKYTSTRMIACLSMAGRSREAAALAKSVRENHPDLTIGEFLARGIVVETAEQTEKFRQGLLGTGLPE
ncbi:adenylate/guanylate cyclase domain-containing protein [Rhizobium laguerreae]|nr:adenylate/guanylate cyclase domain-containing protein [Rhizobium laguerreae]MBY3360273.1 adenylate/guanylate cyclase domain-containing protein [Rhizobium laguerreae]NKM16025.1 adenylate/guanylate cyclase domain-containing protein [Rhizobium laguerreae]